MAFEIKQHDRRPFFVVVLEDNFGESNQAIVNLTSATSVVFNMRATNGTVKISRGAASISNAAGGEVTYQWGASDTDTPGTYDSEVEVVWNDGKSETFPSGPTAGSYWQIVITGDIA